MTKRKELEDLLSQCTKEQQRKFKQMYCFNLLNLDVGISEIVDKVETSKLNLAISQCQNTIKKNLEPKIESIPEVKEVPKVDTIWIDALEKAKEVFYEMRDDSPRKVIGGEEQFDYEIEGKTYQIIVDGFWEKGCWFDLSVTGENYNKSKTIYL